MLPDNISEISIIKHRSNLLPHYFRLRADALRRDEMPPHIRGVLNPFSTLSPSFGAIAPALGALLNFCGKFLVFDVQSSTTEKEQTVSYPMFLKIGAPVHGAGTD